MNQDIEAQAPAIGLASHHFSLGSDDEPVVSVVAISFQPILLGATQKKTASVLAVVRAAIEIGGGAYGNRIDVVRWVRHWDERLEPKRRWVISKHAYQVVGFIQKPDLESARSNGRQVEVPGEFQDIVPLIQE